MRIKRTLRRSHFAACALTLGVTVLVTLSGCGDDGIGYHALGESDAEEVLDDSDVAIPDTYRFGQMTEYRVGFNGKNDYFGRYDATNAGFIDTSALSTANPEFPGFNPTDCSDPVVTNRSLGNLGISCTDTTKLVISTRSNLDLQAYSGPPPDSETLLLTNDGVRTHLFVVLTGH